MSPPNSAIRPAHCALPWISGARQSRRQAAALAGLGLVVLAGQRLAGHEVDAAAERAPDVLVTPHDALGHAGRAAGVEEVEVVVAALVEVALGAARTPAPRSTSVPVNGRSRLVLDDDGVLDASGAPGSASATRSAVDPLVDERDDVGVVEDVLDLLGGVAVVDVDQCGAQLVDRQHRHDRLQPVARAHADVRAGADAVRGQVVGQPVGLLLELGVGHLLVAAGDRGALGEVVDRVLEQIGDVVRPCPQN